MAENEQEELIQNLLQQVNELDDTIEFYGNRSQMLLFAIRTGLRKLQISQPAKEE